MAEDHSGWDKVTMPYDEGGLGFDAAWYSDFYHHLVDFGSGGANWAKLLRNSGYGDGRPLAMSFFAGAVRASGSGKVVYNDSHDEAGNSPGSARTICLAVNNAPLIGATRIWAEARVRVAAGLTLLSAGTPMFFMGEEVGAQEPYRYNDFLTHREDIVGLKAGIGRFLFAYYRDLIALSRATPSIRSHNIEPLLGDDSNRLIAFRRWDQDNELLVVASFNQQAFDKGYRMSHSAFPNKSWREIFNSDAKAYGGAGFGNGGAALTADGNTLNPLVPATGLIILQAQRG
jgi:1,4-alpha-glucan branching enzyme